MLRTNFLKVQLGFILVFSALSAYIKLSPFIYIFAYEAEDIGGFFYK